MFKSFCDNIFNSGTSFTDDPRIKRKIKLTNIICAIGAIFVLIVAIPWFVNAKISYGLYLMIEVLALVLVIVLNSVGKHVFSRVTGMLTVFFFLSYYALLGGPDIGIQFILMMCPIILFTIFDFKQESRYIYSLTALLAIFVFALEVFGFKYIDPIGLPPEKIQEFYYLHIILCLATSFIFMTILMKDTSNTEIELFEQQIEVEKQMNAAEKTSKIKSEFLSNMSHEMRTPLNSILGFTDILDQTSLDSDQKEYLDYVKKASSNMLGLVNDILDFSKFDTSNFSLQKHTFQLENIIKEVQGLLAVTAKAKNIDLYVEINGNAKLKLLGDSKRLKQIFLNLLNNAIKFTKKGHVSFEIKTIEQKDNRVTLEIKIEDTGIGIEQTDIDQIFESFQQAKTNANRLHEGTGLGLAIVKQLVKAMEGNIEVKSEVNTGTTFTLTLPFEISKAITKHKTDDSLEIPIIRASHILIVDDNEMNLILVKKLLSIYDTSIYFATSGEEALLLLEKKRFDVILMDLQMPNMSGLEVHDRLLENKKYALNHDTPYIILTADAFIETRKKALDQGIRAFLTKPINKEELYKTLNQCLSS